MKINLPAKATSNRMLAKMFIMDFGIRFIKNMTCFCRCYVPPLANSCFFLSKQDNQIPNLYSNFIRRGKSP